MTTLDAVAQLRDIETQPIPEDHPLGALRLLARIVRRVLEGDLAALPAREPPTATARRAFQEGVAEADRLLEARRTHDIQDRQLDRGSRTGRVPGVAAVRVPVSADVDVALPEHLTCVIGSHATDGGERVPGVGLVCPDHLDALQRFCGGPT